jgi:hypothetical protein
MENHADFVSTAREHFRNGETDQESLTVAFRAPFERKEAACVCFAPWLSLCHSLSSCAREALLATNLR